jgi:hypothetical protein
VVESEANKVDPMEVKCCREEQDGTNGVIVESYTQGKIGQTWRDRRLIGVIE